MTDWEARVARAKREGTWYTPQEEPSPYPPRVRRLRFLTGFAATLAVGTVLHAVLHLVRGRPGSPLGADALLDGLFRSLVTALFVGWAWTRPPRRRR